MIITRFTRHRIVTEDVTWIKLYDYYIYIYTFVIVKVFLHFFSNGFKTMSIKISNGMFFFWSYRYNLIEINSLQRKILSVL